MKRYGAVAGVCVVVVLLLVAFGPIVLSRVVYGHRVERGCYSVRSDVPLGEALYAVLDSVEANLRRSELYATPRRYKLYLASNHFTYAVFSPTAAGAFANTNPFWTFVSKCSPDSNVVERWGEDYGRRSLSGVLTHELTHNLIWNRMGYFTAMLLPKWKVEGYCDYIARESSFDFDEGMKLVLGGKRHGSDSFFYFASHLCIRFLVEERGLGFMDIVSQPLEMPEVLGEIVAQGYRPISW